MGIWREVSRALKIYNVEGTEEGAEVGPSVGKKPPREKKPRVCAREPLARL